MRKLAAFALVWLGLHSSAAAQDPEATPKPPLHFGKVLLDAEKKRATFPAVVNQSEGVVEYLLVGKDGKIHESLLRTEVEPFQLQTAMLLLGVKSGDKHPGNPPPSAITGDYLRSAPVLKGGDVLLTLKWVSDGKDVTCRAEDWILNTQTHAPCAPGPWIYNGSMFEGSHFLAQEEKSFVALVTDPASLMNNPRPGHDNDLIWSVNKEKVPAKDTAVEVTVALVPSPATPAPTP